MRQVKFDSFVDRNLRIKVRNFDLSDDIHHHRDYLTRQNVIRISKYLENQELYRYTHERLEKTESKITPASFEITIN